MVEEGQTILEAPKGMPIEKMRQVVAKEKRGGKEIKKKERVAKAVEMGVSQYWERVKGGFQSEVDRYQASLNSLSGALKSTPGAQESLTSAMGGWVDVQRQILSATEAQTPEALRLPTPERLFEQGKFATEAEQKDVETRREESPVYQRAVEDWYEERLRNLESFGLAFEEQPSLFSPLVLAQTHFELDEKTREIGEKMREKLEARRKRQRLVRIWGVAGAETISNEGNAIDNATLKELFTYETREGEKPIEREFQNYEKMGVELAKLKERIEAVGGDEKSVLEDERDGRTKIIQDYYNHGGYVDDQGKVVGVEMLIAASRKKEDWKYLDEYIKESKKTGGEEIRKLEEILWARRFSGGLWSITLRAGKFGVTLNGLGDLFAQRAINPAEAFAQRGLLRKTRGIWDPKVGDYAGKPLDFGYTDYFSAALSGVKEQRRSGGVVEKGARHIDWLKNVGGITRDQYKIRGEEGGGKEEEPLKVVNSLATARLGDKKFWEDLENVYNAGTKYGDNIVKFKQADETRSRFWGANSFFHNLDLENFLKLSEVYGHVSETLVTATAYETKKGESVRVELMKDGRPIQVTEREQAWFELVDRTLQWTKTDEAKEVLETLKVFPASERFAWIEETSESEMISNEQRDYLLKKYLDFPVPGTALSKAHARITLSNVIGVFRNKDTRQLLLTGQFLEFIKRAFVFVFQDDIRIR